MQQWNQHFSDENREDNIRRDDRVTNRQSDFEREGRQQNQFNMPYGNEGFGQPYTDTHQHNDLYSNYQNERFRSQQPYSWEDDMRMEQRGRNIERDWDNLRSWANDFTNRNNMDQGNRNPYINTRNANNYGETYNPENRNFNPLFADDEGGFSGGFQGNDEEYGGSYNRDFGFDRGNSFYNRHPQSWPENNFMNQNRQEGQNRWHNNKGNNQQEDRGGFFGH